MTGHGRAFQHIETTDYGRLPASAAEMKHWLAEVVFTDAPLGGVGGNALTAAIDEDVVDRRARRAIEAGVCHRRLLLSNADRRHRGRSW